MAASDYTITLNTATTTNNTSTAITTVPIASNYYSIGYRYCTCTGYCSHTWTYPYYWNTVTTEIYKYQVKCPKCKTTNWLELDKVTPCKKCDSTLRAIEKPSVDFEIEIED